MLTDLNQASLIADIKGTFPLRREDRPSPREEGKGGLGRQGER